MTECRSRGSESDECALLGCFAEPVVVVDHRGRPERETYLCELHGKRAMSTGAKHLRDVSDQ